MSKNWKDLNRWENAAHYRKADRWVGVAVVVCGIIGYFLPWGGA